MRRIENSWQDWILGAICYDEPVKSRNFRVEIGKET